MIVPEAPTAAAVAPMVEEVAAVMSAVGAAAVSVAAAAGPAAWPWGCQKAAGEWVAVVEVYAGWQHSALEAP